MFLATYFGDNYGGLLDSEKFYSSKTRKRAEEFLGYCVKHSNKDHFIEFPASEAPYGVVYDTDAKGNKYEVDYYRCKILELECTNYIVAHYYEKDGNEDEEFTGFISQEEAKKYIASELKVPYEELEKYFVSNCDIDDPWCHLYDDGYYKNGLLFRIMKLKDI